MIKRFLGAAVAATALMLATSAGAVVTIEHFSFTQFDPASFSAPAGFTSLGDITVTDNGLNLFFDIQLKDGYEFKKSNNDNFHALAWDMSNNGDVVTNLVNNLHNNNLFQRAGSAFAAPPFTTGAGNTKFNYAIDCGHTCVNGPNLAVDPTHFSFKILGASINKLVAKNKRNGVDVWFASDVSTVPGHGPFTASARAQTFNVGAVYEYTSFAVPEPSTWAMMIMGFGAIGAAARVQRRRAPAIAA
jgi:hypothetical protein